MDPIRVYVGLNSKETIDERAKLALEELKRLKAFNREILILVTPTGTGWMDPYSMDTVEYLHGGDTAIIGVQYSYFQSPIAMVVEPEKSKQTAQAMFHEVYNYWTTLPKDRRPKLYLHGVSLGSFGSEHSFKVHETMNDQIRSTICYRTISLRSAIPDHHPGYPPIKTDHLFVSRLKTMSNRMLPASGVA